MEDAMFQRPPPVAIGPMVQVSNSHMSMAVIREYTRSPNSRNLWSGKIGMFDGKMLVLEVEVSLMPSREADGLPWVALPTRPNAQGQKPVRTVYFGSTDYLAAIGSAIEGFRSSGPPEPPF